MKEKNGRMSLKGNAAALSSADKSACRIRSRVALRRTIRQWKEERP